MDIGPVVSDFPRNIPNCGKLYLTASLAETQTLLRNEACNAGLECEEPFAKVIALSVSDRQLQQLTRAWADALSIAELERTRCYLTDSHDIPSNAELMNSQTLGSVIDWVNGRWLNEIIEFGRLVTHFQPIVRIADPEVVYGYECLLRGQGTDGELISPSHLYSAARGAGLVDHLDCTARIIAIHSASCLQLSTRVFVNFNPRSIDTNHQSIQSTLRAAMASSIPMDGYVFEVVESDEISDIDSLMEITDHLRDAGCLLALDDVGAGYNSLNLVAQLKPDFIKIDMGLIRGVGDDFYKARVTAKLLELARELDVKTVVEGVETESEWRWTVQHGADFGQGYFFARPAAVPPQSAFLAQVATNHEGLLDEELAAAAGD